MAVFTGEEIKVIYEDTDLLILDKPAGWVVTKENRMDSQMTIEDWMRSYKKIDLPRAGIVHRLDKGTSGVLVVAKNIKSLDYLKAQFKQRKVVKHYWAVVGGDLPGSGNIKMPIIRSNYVFSRYKVGESGKPAETEFKLIKKFKIEGKMYSLIDINLKTGRTHQIRVHLSYLGWPLLGDKVYGGAMVSGIERPFLHAYELTIKHPVSGVDMKFESPLSDDLKEVMLDYGQI
jgi:23S rRNA pseudouridine1911/1915/1917 synthase